MQGDRSLELKCKLIVNFKSEIDGFLLSNLGIWEKAGYITDQSGSVWESEWDWKSE